MRLASPGFWAYLCCVLFIFESFDPQRTQRKKILPGPPLKREVETLKGLIPALVVESLRLVKHPSLDYWICVFLSVVFQQSLVKDGKIVFFNRRIFVFISNASLILKILILSRFKESYNCLDLNFSE